MASVFPRRGGHWWLQFPLDGKKKTMRLGKTSQRAAQEVKHRVEQILAARRLSVALDLDTAGWVASLPDEQHTRLAATGLVAPRARGRLGEFLDRYIAGRRNLKPGSLRHLRAGADLLLTHFGADRDLRTITEADADAWLVWLQTSVSPRSGRVYAKSTVGRTVKRAKEFLAAAIRARLLVDNPFQHLRASEEVIKSRQQFVRRETIARVLDACPSVRWQLVFALVRYAGLRCPGDVGALLWANVDWDAGTLGVESPKTGWRRVPIFPELRAVLDRAWAAPIDGATHVVPNLGKEQNLHTDAVRVIARAGLEPWPKLFNNLRASCETEWLRTYPIGKVAAWMGHSPSVALKHYATAEMEDFEEFRVEARQEKSALPNPKHSGAGQVEGK